MKIKSIFIKQLLIHLGILLVAFTLLATVLSYTFSAYYRNEKTTQLIEQGKRIANEYYQYFYTGTIDIMRIQNEIDILENYMNATVFFLDSKGEVSISNNDELLGKTITDDAIAEVLEGKIVTVEGNIGDIFKEDVLTVGYPIALGGGHYAGFFMCASIPAIQQSINQMYVYGGICIICVMIVGIGLVYLSSRSLTKPLKEMNDAAKVIAKGDFEKRLTVGSDDEIGQLAQSFNEMAESLEEHDKQTRDFIANISHDLRSPLTSIQGFLSAVLDGTVPDDKKEHYLNIALEETHRLSKLTNDIVDLSRAQSRK